MRNSPLTMPDANPSPPEKKKRLRWKHVFIVMAGVAVLLLACVAVLAWYANSAGFQDRVRRQMIATIEQATGGRVELKDFRWRLMHLEVEANDLTIHGLEPAGEIPYAHIDKLKVQAKILSFFSPRIGLSLLVAQHPVFHLIVNPDGSTNQPQPKTVRNDKPIGDTLFDLAIDQVEIADGLAILNERKIPFDVAAKNLGATIRYHAGSPDKERYVAHLTVADLTAHRGKQPPVGSTIELNAALGRNAAELTSFRLKTASSVLDASGSIVNYSNPQWNVATTGEVDVRELEALTEIEGLKRGIATLNLRVKGEGADKFSLDGQAKVKGGAYTTVDVTLQGVDASTDVHASQDELLLSNAVAKLRQGGVIEGEFRFENCLAPTPDTSSAQKSQAKPVPNSKGRKTVSVPVKAAQPVGTIRAKISRITLRTVLDATAPRDFQDIGFDTAATGLVNVDWAGPFENMTLAAKVSLAPPPGTPTGEAPLSGQLEAEYFNRRGTVKITTLEAKSPGTIISVRGDLGVYPDNRTSAIQGDIIVHDLSEFDRTLTALGLVANGKKGVKALPLELRGEAEFHGQLTGTIYQPTLNGKLTATNFATLIPATVTTPETPTAAQANAALQPDAEAATGERKIEWDKLEASGQYSLAEIAIHEATITKGSTVVHASGAIRPHRINPRRADFDEQSGIDATVAITNAEITDLLSISGQGKIPVTGVVTSLNIHAGGTLNNLSGGGSVAGKGGEIYGEPYHSANADLRFAGRELAITKFSLLQNGARITADGAYNTDTKIFRANAQGRNFDLSHLHRLQGRKYAVGGRAEFDAHATGNLENPAIHATARLDDLTLADQHLGNVVADAYSEHGSLFYTTDSVLSGAKLHISGQTELKGDYISQARLTFSELDIDPLLKLSGVEGITTHSSIEGDMTVSGPFKQPRKLNGEANISQFAISLAGVPLQSDGPLHVALRDGVLQLDPVHITGEDTNLRAQGTANIFGTRELQMHANGEVNLKLAQTVNRDITSSGRVTLSMDARGTIDQPDLVGQVQFTNAAIALQDMPNGLSQINGTLQFNQNRLDVKTLTAQTGGGQLKLGGYITYDRGLFGDLTATGKNIRVRYPTGVSSMADATLRLQGTQKNLLLSGNVLITRFAINPNLDISGLAGSAQTVAPPIDPDSPSNHVRLDIHITSAPSLNFQNSYAKLAGDVDLRVRGTIASPSVLGRINVTEGSANFAGTKYQLQHGDIFFTNPVRIDPTIDLDATARVESYDVTIGLHGTANKLNVSYRSEPPLPQQDVIALLALGRTQEEQNMYTQQQQNQGTNSTTNALLGGALNATVSNRVQKLFGVGSVKIDPTFVGSLGNSTARVTVEQQISRNVKLTYATNVNSTAQQLIQAQVDITRNVSVVAVRDENGVFSMVLKVHRRYR
jgi:translocation and assembly module TamB